MRTMLVDPNRRARPYAARVNDSSVPRQSGASTATYPLPSLANRAVVHERRAKARVVDLSDPEAEDPVDTDARSKIGGDRFRTYEMGFMDDGECILAYDPSGRLASALRIHDDD